MKLQMSVKDSKVEVLKYYWTKVVSKILTKAMKTKDAKAQDLGQRILKVPESIKVACLKHYIKQCR
jgi:hypothetical protein